MCTNEKANQTFLQHLPVPVQQVVKSFKGVNPSFICWKNSHMQISCKRLMNSKFWCTPQKNNK